VTGFRGFCFLVSGCTKVDFVVGGGFRGFRSLGSGFRASDWISWISWISLFRQTGFEVRVLINAGSRLNAGSQINARVF